MAAIFAFSKPLLGASPFPFFNPYFPFRGGRVARRREKAYAREDRGEKWGTGWNTERKREREEVWNGADVFPIPCIGCYLRSLKQSSKTWNDNANRAFNRPRNERTIAPLVCFSVASLSTSFVPPTPFCSPLVDVASCCLFLFYFFFFLFFLLLFCFVSVLAGFLLWKETSIELNRTYTSCITTEVRGNEITNIVQTRLVCASLLIRCVLFDDRAISRAIKPPIVHGFIRFTTRYN